MGLSTSAGINIFLREWIAEKGLPFAPTTDLKKIRAAVDAQTAKAIKSKKYPSASAALRGL